LSDRFGGILAVFESLLAKKQLCSDSSLLFFLMSKKITIFFKRQNKVKKISQKKKIFSHGPLLRLGQIHNKTQENTTPKG
jgi:hypothetical protein